MHIEFAKVDEAFIKASVAGGYYKSEAEVVRDAVRRIREDKERARAELYEALRLGDADIEAGRTKPYTRELFEDIVKRARERAKKNV